MHTVIVCSATMQLRDDSHGLHPRGAEQKADNCARGDTTQAVAILTVHIQNPIVGNNARKDLFQSRCALMDRSARVSRNKIIEVTVKVMLLAKGVVLSDGAQIQKMRHTRLNKCCKTGSFRGIPP
jgi:hypothetical protein